MHTRVCCYVVEHSKKGVLFIYLYQLLMTVSSLLSEKCTIHTKTMNSHRLVPFIHFWVTVCKTVHPMLSDRRVCLSVTFVQCCLMVGRINMKLGMQVGLGPGHIVLDGDPASLPLAT